VCPPELAVQLAELGLTVVTQPSLLSLRGDDYVERVDAEDLPALWPFASLLAAGVPVGCSSDAPYGNLDPWQTIASAVERRTPSNLVVGEAERVPASVALTRFLTAAGDPGGEPRRIARGADADLIVLDRPLADALRRPQDVRVRHTLIGGRVVHSLEAVRV
jgi:predicted amidohydrolase YtcJ